MDDSSPPSGEVPHTKLVKAGGVLMILAGILVLVTIPLISILIPSLAPSSASAGLLSINSQAFLYSTTWALYLASDLLYGVVLVALFYALRGSSRTLMLAGLVLNSLFVAVDVIVDIPLRLYLVILSDSYNPSQPSTSLLATAQSTMDASNLVALVATILQFTAVIVASYAMLRSVEFRKAFAYLGVICGVVAILFVPAFALGGMQLAGIINIGGFVLLVAWSVLAGNRLRKLR